MQFVVTPVVVALMGLILLGLSWRVVDLRRRHRINLGDGGRPDLERAIRVHGNFVEYVPLALLLLLVLEAGGEMPRWLLAALGGLLVVGRLLHAQGLASRPGASFGRFAGTLATWVTILLASALNLYGAIF
ncbi:MAG: MAPEG family protein [Alphaproteobacteria bacterium]|nr:MAPEG family protein [Alphaproteobacteria bacterium]